MGQQQSREIKFEQPSPYASAVVRKTPHLGTTASSNHGGMRRARSIRHDVNSGVGGFQSSHHHHSSSTASSSQKSTSNSTVSSSAGTRYIPHMKSGKGLTMPRGGAPLHGAGSPADSNGYTSPDSWGFHINITPTQEVYAANAGGQTTGTSGIAPTRRQNQVFKNLQSSNTTNMGWTSVPI